VRSLDRQLVAHLGLTTRLSIPKVLVAAVRARGSFDRMEVDLTARRAASLAYVACNKFLGGPRRLAGVRVVSTDTGWSLGEGPTVEGHGIDLLLAVAGRPAVLDALSGPGLERLAAQL
jgi:hypothetical protein